MTSPHLASPAARYLAGYPPELIAQAEALRSEGRLADYLARRFPERHEVRSDGALVLSGSAGDIEFRAQ